jgi:nucleobase:cation symporter-1, NCS1 family
MPLTTVATRRKTRRHHRCDWLGWCESTQQPNGGGRAVAGGRGRTGGLALISVIFGAITSNAMNDYSGSLALQAAGVKLRRNWSAALGTGLGFCLILWIHGGNTSGKFQSVLLFSAYWIAPFLVIVLIDWHGRQGSSTHEGLSALMDLKNLSTGWRALVSLVVGFGAMVPFMNTGALVGPIAKALDGADLSFYVGVLVAGAVYLALRKFVSPNQAMAQVRTGSHTSSLESARSAHGVLVERLPDTE